MAAALGAAWAVEVGLIAVRDLAGEERRPPLPSELLASFVVFGALGVLAIPAPKAANLIGWGLVVATLLSSSVDVLAPVGDFMAGKYATPRPAPEPVNRIQSTNLGTVLGGPPLPPVR